jgi:glycosyltransferase involved in cell wall biosynthesis
MRIAVNTAVLASNQREAHRVFVQGAFGQLTNRFPEHQFIFISDGTWNKEVFTKSNITHVKVWRPVKMPLLWRFWSDVTVSAVLRRYKLDVLISTGRCSLKAQVPQCLLMPHLGFLHRSSHVREAPLSSYDRSLAKSFQKAKYIVTATEFLKEELVARYNIGRDKITVIYSAAREIFQPLSTELSEAVKIKYSQGKEYFLYTGVIDHTGDVVGLLKAFSIFKKRQKSNMKLLCAGRAGKKYASFVKALGTYKHRADVILLKDPGDEELAKVTGAAYALVPLSLDSADVSVFEAMKCQVPLITAQAPVEQIVKDAALYADPKNVEDMADKMMHIYKDENLRKELIEKEKAVASEYSWQRTAELLWQIILKTAD